MRHPVRWLLWGFGGLFVGLPALVLALVCLVLILSVAVTSGANASTSTTSGTPLVVPSGVALETSQWAGASNPAVVAEALRIVAALYTGPPDSYTTWYHAEQIPDALAYWQRTCTGGCATNWAEGSLQCTMLVTASYGLVGQDLPFAGDAATFVTWHPYLNRPGWQEVPPTEQPIPGDILVLDSGSAFDGAGHVAIVVAVRAPDPISGQGGFVRFAQANAAQALAQEPVTRDANGLHMQIWSGYTVLGYIRHLSALS